ncbi:predicted protein [Plenodomus lingam JN3]|uniref:Predicted protein n=1 Tax=Leptosphaeria maculans (strain JN3 / isolate v23.1.3 / race Av1-4-5-6-7-8) TaxID=985895 RepID=E5AFA3_LEPMJ|nr:predicted protein [Plenodomus lingam JN3]CBY01892.1 predicted protein [Plenodomus lingam JN3]
MPVSTTSQPIKTFGGIGTLPVQGIVAEPHGPHHDSRGAAVGPRPLVAPWVAGKEEPAW